MGYIIVFLLVASIAMFKCYIDTESFSLSLVWGGTAGIAITFFTYMFLTILFAMTPKEVILPVEYREVIMVENVAVVIFDVDGKTITKSINTDEVPMSFGDDQSVIISYDEPRVDNMFGRLFWIEENPKATDERLLEDGSIEKIIVDKSVIK